MSVSWIYCPSVYPLSGLYSQVTLSPCLVSSSTRQSPKPGFILLSAFSTPALGLLWGNHAARRWVQPLCSLRVSDHKTGQQSCQVSPAISIFHLVRYSKTLTLFSCSEPLVPPVGHISRCSSACKHSFLHLCRIANRYTQLKVSMN